MALKFRRKRRLNIDYIEQIKRFAFIVDFKGRSINSDITALCYLRACKEILLFYVGTGQWVRLNSNNADADGKAFPYLVHDSEREPVSKSLLLRHEEEVHRAAESLFSAYYEALRMGNGSSVLEMRWSLR